MTGGAGCAEAVRSLLGLHADRWTNSTINYSNLLLDLENAQPTESERQLYDVAENVLERARTVLAVLSDYGEGPSDIARKALMSQSDAEKEECIRILEPFVERIRAAHSVARMIQQVLPRLLWELCGGPLAAMELLEQKQALVRQLAHLIEWSLCFDWMKARTSAIVNHFSIYRRLTSTCETFSSIQDLHCDNDLTWFLATANPMVDLLCKTTESFVREQSALPLENTLQTMYTIMRVCCCMLASPGSCLPSSSQILLLRVVVGSLLLYDIIHPEGAFSRNSSIDIRTIVALIAANPENKQQLLNPLIEAVSHCRKATVHPKIRALLSTA